MFLFIRLRFMQIQSACFMLMYLLFKHILVSNIIIYFRFYVVLFVEIKLTQFQGYIIYTITFKFKVVLLQFWTLLSLQVFPFSHITGAFNMIYTQLSYGSHLFLKEWSVRYLKCILDWHEGKKLVIWQSTELFSIFEFI